ncbi:MAG TPA: hypothetical protein ENH82_09655 [bacterium]|nr:hypothetical protein [bacterium]
MIRVITASTNNGEREEVIFTEEFNKPAEDFFFMDGMTIDLDEQIEDLPSRFPMEYVLKRS